MANNKGGFKMKAKFVGFLKDEAGQGMTEYGLIIALIAVVVIGALTLMGGNIKALLTTAAGSIK
ncbi:Flp family type IVb pilin [Desulfosporosinus metallidurans]|nr:Flp family type IVb pilin [Desulfosporosinus metallidurans]